MVCKLVRTAGRVVGRGSSLPGKFALRICPDILGKIKLPPRIIAVTGSNGKTSTVEMAASILKLAGKKVIYNAEGSNQVEGVATLLLSNSSLKGEVKADVLLMESDERYAQYSFKWFHPDCFVITNLYRDQLTRNGNPEWVFNAVKKAVHPQTTLVLNADDPLVSCLAEGHDRDKVKWFGVAKSDIDTKEPQGVYDDGARCPVCRGPMEYSSYHFHHIGHYRCPRCGFRRHDPDIEVTELDLKNGRMVIGPDHEISLAFRSIYNVYNILAAWSACFLAGVPEKIISDAVNNYILRNGRMVRFTLGKHKGTLLTSKHENSVAYDTNISYVNGIDSPCDVMIIVDAISRKYFTGETSWLWDIDFNALFFVENMWQIWHSDLITQMSRMKKYPALIRWRKRRKIWKGRETKSFMS